MIVKFGKKQALMFCYFNILHTTCLFQRWPWINWKRFYLNSSLRCTLKAWCMETSQNKWEVCWFENCKTYLWNVKHFQEF